MERPPPRGLGKDLSPSPTGRRCHGSRSPSTVSLLEGRSLSLSRLSPGTTWRPTTPTYGLGERSRLDLSRTDLLQHLDADPQSSTVRGVEELRSTVRELQRQVRQAPHAWRQEIEAEVQTAQAKANGSTQQAVEALATEMRAEMEQAVEQAVRGQLRRCNVMDESFEALKSSTSKDVGALRLELSSAVKALAQAAHAGPGLAVEVLHAHGGAQLENRLQALEQQLQQLQRVSARSTADEVRTEVEQRMASVDVKLRELRGQTSQQQDYLHEMKASLADGMSKQLSNVQAQLEELQNERTANVKNLEAGIEMWRQRVDKVLAESEQRLYQEVEKRFQANQDQMTHETKSTTVELDGCKKTEQKLAQEMRQLSVQVSSLESTQTSNHESVGSNVSGLLQRLTVAEMTISEERSKREILIRQLEERMELLGESQVSRSPQKESLISEGDVASPPKEVAKMALQLEANETAVKRLLQDMQSFEKALDRVNEGQRKLVQEQAQDISRQESSRLEERKGNEKNERKLKARLDELEARLELVESPPEKQGSELSVRLEEHRKMLQEQDGRQRQIEDVMKEAQPMLKLLQEHETRLVKSLDMSQQLQRQHLEFKSELESHKDVLEVRCIERLEIQGKRLEELGKRMEHLDESKKTTLLQVGHEKRREDYEKRLQLSEQQLEELREQLGKQEGTLGQQGREVKKDLQQMLEKQRRYEQQHSELKKELLQFHELHDQLMTTCGQAQAELNKQAKSIGEVESNAVDSITQKSFRMETSIAKLDPRISSLEETVKDLLQELGTRLRGFDSSILQLEPRMATIESQMPRLQEASKMTSVLNSEVKSSSENFQTRFTRMEAELLKLNASSEKAEPALDRMQAWLEKSDERFYRLSVQHDELEEQRSGTQQSLVKVEATCKKVNQQVESSLERLQGFEYRLTAFDTRLCTVEPLTELQAALAEVRHQHDGLDSKAASLDSAQKRLATHHEALQGEHRDLLKQLVEQKALLADLTEENSKSKEEMNQIRSRTEVAERTAQQVSKAQEYQQNDATEFQQALELSQQRLKGEMQARLEETRASVEKQTRSLAVLQHSRQDVEHHMESLRREVAQERNVSSAAAVEASKAAQEATAMANRAVEASKELFQEQAEQKEQFLRQFEDWKLQAQEEAARRVLEAQDVAVGDLLKSMDRHRFQTKEDTLKTREELLQMIKSNSNLFDGKVAEVQQRLQLLAVEAGRSLGDLNGDLEKLRRCDQGLEASLPGLLGLRGAVEDEQKRRQVEAQRFSERLQEQSREKMAVSRLSQYQDEPEKAASFTVLDGLKGCEQALTAMDRRVTNLEDCLEDKLYSMVRLDVNKHAAMQQSHLEEVEQKVDKLVHSLHTPSGHDAASFSASGPLGSRDEWRDRFRNALNDSSYVRRVLHTRT